jgi:ubiquinol-cytochrome c reductase subunit 7
MAAVIDAIQRPVLNLARRWLGNKCARYGLHAEDLWFEDYTVCEAIDLSPPEVRIGRNRRIKRAMDLSFKKKNYLTYQSRESVDVWEHGFRDLVEKIEERDMEVDLLRKNW